ncbi:hypothetical protein STAL104432_11355 [Streptomyces albus]
MTNPAVMSTGSQAMSRQVAGSFSSSTHRSTWPTTPPLSRRGHGRYGSGTSSPPHARTSLRRWLA